MSDIILAYGHRSELQSDTIGTEFVLGKRKDGDDTVAILLHIWHIESEQDFLYELGYVKGSDYYSPNVKGIRSEKQLTFDTAVAHEAGDYINGIKDNRLRDVLVSTIMQDDIYNLLEGLISFREGKYKSEQEEAIIKAFDAMLAKAMFSRLTGLLGELEASVEKAIKGE